MVAINPGLFINGSWILAEKLPNFPSLNPVNEKVLGMVPEASPQQLDDAVQAAHKALGVWGQLPGPERAQYLLNTAKQFEDHQSEVVELLIAETGSTFSKVAYPCSSLGVQTLLHSFINSYMSLRLCSSWIIL
jgi:acyl-CoA reductase-like NAD-dependent aldehyde dehydrogenase